MISGRRKVVLPQPSKLKSWVRFPSAAHFDIMKVRNILIIIMLLFLTGCIKTKEQKQLNKQKALDLQKKADTLYFENKFDKALELYLEIENLDITSPVMEYKIAFCYDKGFQKIDKAEKYYLKALKGLDVRNHIKILSALYFNLGLIASKHKDLGKKFEYYNRSFSLLEKMLEVDAMQGEDFFRLAYLYMDKNNYDKALEYYLISIKYFKKNNPDHFYYAGAYFNIGILYWKQENISTSLYYWKRALAIEPDNEQYLIWHKKAKQIKDAGGLQ